MTYRSSFLFDLRIMLIILSIQRVMRIDSGIFE